MGARSGPEPWRRPGRRARRGGPPGRRPFCDTWGRAPSGGVQGGIAGLDDEGAGGIRRGVRLGDVTQRAEVDLHLPLGENGPHVAAAAVEELHVRVLGQEGLGVGGRVDAVALGGDRGGDQLDGDGRRLGVGVVALHLARPVGVNVSGEDHAVAPVVGDGRRHPVAAGDVAVPALVGVAVRRAVRPVHLHEEDLLAEQVPDGPGVAEPAAQPGLLVGAEDGAVLVEPVGAVVADGAGLAGARVEVAILPGVEHVHVGEGAPAQRVVQRHLGAFRPL
uniref:FunU13 n=1 Tax=Streptosporangium sp. KD35 TaxID=2162663 RepID=A0A2U9KCV7_9ACTN|nr:FunU13 [Streptosporangium sp. KD35]